jgi:tetratricopeptide (TPR) repeat protein
MTVLLLAVLLAAPTSPAGPPPPAPQTELAQRHFRMGVTLYEDGDFDGARSEFLRAHDLAPSYRILFNLGQVSQELRDWAGALRYYGAYLEAGGANVPDLRRRTVEDDIQALRARVAELTIEISRGPVELVLDDRPVTAAADGVLTLNPGRRRLTATYPGGVTVSRVLDVASGDRLRERFAPPVTRPAPPPAPAPLATTSAPRAEPRRLPTAAWWAWAATGMVGAAALTTGLLAQNESQALAQERGQYPANPEGLLGRQHRVRRYALATDALLAGGLALGITSLYLSVAPSWRF